MHILSPITDNCSSWISRRGRIAVEIFSSPRLHERVCRTWGSNSGRAACSPSGHASDRATAPGQCHNWDPCDAKIYHIKCMWFSDLHFMVQWFCLISWTTWWINVVLEILIHCDTNIELKLSVYVGQWPTFHGPVILPYILKTIWWTNVITEILDPCDAKINHIKCVWVSDQHFVVQWFWHILKTFWWRNVGLKIIIQCDIKFDLQYICRSVTYILWYSDSAL